MLSAIVITKNEEAMITDCLISLAFADEIIIVDSGNTDRTNDIAKEHGARIVKTQGTNYSKFRNDGLKAARGNWILYVDADERVTPLLREEILQITQKKSDSHTFALSRKNIYLGKSMQYGGWGDDYVIRLFYKPNLEYWQFPLHEQPVYKGELVKLNNQLVHFSHRGLSSMTRKTLEFTEFESQNRFDAHHPPVTWWRMFRVALTEFYLRFITKKAFKDGAEGIIDGLFQVFNTIIIYSRLWEKQQITSKK